MCLLRQGGLAHLARTQNGNGGPLRQPFRDNGRQASGYQRISWHDRKSNIGCYNCGKERSALGQRDFPVRETSATG
ncbi:MAG: hypothetical protein GFGODING_02592 [Flavobacteriales bacterium]|nr:hypothetical protein [Flavobacteriales bacterium]